MVSTSTKVLSCRINTEDYKKIEAFCKAKGINNSDWLYPFVMKALKTIKPVGD